MPAGRPDGDFRQLSTHAASRSGSPVSTAAAWTHQAADGPVGSAGDSPSEPEVAIRIGSMVQSRFAHTAPTSHIRLRGGPPAVDDGPTSSHDRRFKAENAGRRSDLFHVTMAWKRLGLNRHKTNLCQLVYIAFDSAAIALQSLSDDCD